MAPIHRRIKSASKENTIKVCVLVIRRRENEMPT
jgi:hypothetical protein